MNFKRIADELPIAQLVEALDRYPRLWERHTIRQEFFCSPHWATESIYIRGPREFTFENYFGTTDALDYDVPEPLFRAVSRCVLPVYHELGATALGRVLIVELPPGGVLIEHVDEGLYADHYERVHVALQTNPRAELVCNGEAKHIPAGEAWWFDHRAPHTAHNRGDSERVHMIVDLVAPGIRNNDAAGTS